MTSYDNTMNFYSVCFADMPMKTIEFLSKECVDGLERGLYLLLDLAWYTRRFIAQATPLCVLGVAATRSHASSMSVCTTIIIVNVVYYFFSTLFFYFFVAVVYTLRLRRY